MTNEADEQPISLTECLNDNGIALTPVAANKILHAAGMLEKRWRDSSKPGRPPKQYRAATPLGEQHGIVNEAATVPTGDPVTVKYLPGMFPALWAHPDVAVTLAAMLREGTVKLRQCEAQEAF
jgi:hypothetical protein